MSDEEEREREIFRQLHVREMAKQTTTRALVANAKRLLESMRRIQSHRLSRSFERNEISQLPNQVRDRLNFDTGSTKFGKLSAKISSEQALSESYVTLAHWACLDLVWRTQRSVPGRDEKRPSKLETSNINQFAFPVPAISTLQAARRIGYSSIISRAQCVCES